MGVPDVPGGWHTRVGGRLLLHGRRLDPPVRGVGYEPSGNVPGEPRDPLSLHKSTISSSRLPIHHQLKTVLKPCTRELYPSNELRDS